MLGPAALRVRIHTVATNSFSDASCQISSEIFSQRNFAPPPLFYRIKMKKFGSEAPSPPPPPPPGSLSPSNIKASDSPSQFQLNMSYIFIFGTHIYTNCIMYIYFIFHTVHLLSMSYSENAGPFWFKYKPIIFFRL
jgi:hypothetical protein